jgi:hypothetical protein
MADSQASELYPEIYPEFRLLQGIAAKTKNGGIAASVLLCRDPREA